MKRVLWNSKSIKLVVTLVSYDHASHSTNCDKAFGMNFLELWPFPYYSQTVVIYLFVKILKYAQNMGQKTKLMDLSCQVSKLSWILSSVYTMKNSGRFLLQVGVVKFTLIKELWANFTVIKSWVLPYRPLSKFCWVKKTVSKYTTNICMVCRSKRNLMRTLLWMLAYLLAIVAIWRRWKSQEVDYMIFVKLQ